MQRIYKMTDQPKPCEMPLKPCPFCGEQPQVVDHEEENDNASYSKISCENRMCGMQPKTYHFTPSAFKLFRINWNTRADRTPSPSEEDVREARSVLKRAEYNDMTNLLCDIAQILDVVKQEWGEAWTAFDQSCRDRITYQLSRPTKE